MDHLCNLTVEEKATIWKEMEEAQGGTANYALIAGYMVGLATSSRISLGMEDRILIAKAGEYLRRLAFAEYATAKEQT